MADVIPYLYLLARNDLASMDKGRTAAQISHATSDFHERMHDIRNRPMKAEDTISSTWETWFSAWKVAGSFGTAIVLMGDLTSIRGAVEFATQANVLSGITHDPTYVLRDGATIHLLPVDTCGWIFGPKSLLLPLLGKWPLLREIDV